jgi:hypothetical protein
MGDHETNEANRSEQGRDVQEGVDPVREWDLVVP